MEINFSLTKKDYWAYNKYSLINVGAIARIFVLTPAIIFAIIFAAGLIMKLKIWIVIGVSLLLPLIYVASIILPMYMGIMKISNDKLLPIDVNIDLEKKQIIKTMNGKETKYNKANVYKMKMRSNYIFITMTTYSALIIPKSNDYSLDEVYNTLVKII